MEYALLIWIHASILSNSDSATSSVIYGFATQETCQTAAKEVSNITDMTTKVIKTKCVRTK